MSVLFSGSQRGAPVQRRSSWRSLPAWAKLSWLAIAAILVIPLSGKVFAAQAAPDELVRQTTQQVLGRLSDDPGLVKDQERLFGMVSKLVLPHFDFRRMSQRVLGKHWRAATSQQKADFIDGYQRLLVRTYATALSTYKDQQISVSDASRRGGKTLVKMTVTRPGAPPIPVTYHMAERDGHWKVTDVTIDGVSLTINYRSSFNSEIRKSGIDGLIRRLRQHNEGQG